MGSRDLKNISLNDTRIHIYIFLEIFGLNSIEAGLFQV